MSDGCKQKLSIQQCDQTAADRNVVTIDSGNSSPPYPAVPSPTPYDVRFSQPHYTSRVAQLVINNSKRALKCDQTNE